MRMRIPTGASALGMTHRYDSRSDYRSPLSLRASAHTGVAIRSPTIILQITLLVSVNMGDLYSYPMQIISGLIRKIL